MVVSLTTQPEDSSSSYPTYVHYTDAEGRLATSFDNTIVYAFEGELTDEALEEYVEPLREKNVGVYATVFPPVVEEAMPLDDSVLNWLACLVELEAETEDSIQEFLVNQDHLEAEETVELSLEVAE